MSEVKVNKLSPRSGTTVTLGDSGDTITIPSGVTLANSGTIDNLNASNLTSGTVPSARVSGAYTGITQVGTLTGLTTGAITSTGNFTFNVADGMNINTKESLNINIDTDDNDSSRAFAVTSGSGGTSETLISASEDAGVRLYYDNSNKIETTSTGIAVTGGVALGGTGTANTLDDYEEGTWTPSASVGSVSHIAGGYIKIGRLVTLTIDLLNFSESSSTANIQINGIPFAVDSSENMATGAMFGERIDTNNNGNSVQAVLTTSSSGIFFFNGVGSTNFAQLRYADINDGADCAIRGTITYLAAS